MSLTLLTALRLGRYHSLSELNEQEGVVLDLRKKLFRGVNEPALHVLGELERARDTDDSRTIADLAASTREVFDVDAPTLVDDITEFLTVCLDKGIVETVQAVLYLNKARPIRQRRVGESKKPYGRLRLLADDSFPAVLFQSGGPPPQTAAVGGPPPPWFFDDNY